MLNWEDREYVNPRKKVFKNLDTDEILNLELQDDPDNISKESETPLTAHNLNQAQQELIDDLGKTYKDTNITAPTVAGYGRIKKLYGKTEEEGTGEKSPDNPYMLKCVGDDVNIYNETSNTETTTQYAALSTGKISLIAGEKYTISFDTNNNGGTVYTDETIFTSSTTVACDGKRKSVTRIAKNTITDGIANLVKAFVATSTAYKIKNVKVQKGSVSTLYSAYGYSTIENISTDGTNTSSNILYVDKPLCSVGDVRDELDYTNRKITRRCGYVVLNGRENVSGQNGQYYVLVNCAYGVINAICSHYTKTKDWDEHGSSGDNFIVYRHEGWAQGRISFKDTTFSNVTEFKTYLAEQYAKGTPVTVIYELATPTIEDIDCSDKIVQYANNTNIYNRDGAEIEVSFTNNESISALNENIKSVEEDVNEAISDINELDANIETRAKREIRKNYGLGGECKTVGGNLNTCCGNATGFYMGIGLTNSPTNNSQEWFFIIHIVHNSSYQHQIAMSFNSASLYNRFMKDGVWSNWASR